MYPIRTHTLAGRASQHRGRSSTPEPYRWRSQGRLVHLCNKCVRHVARVRSLPCCTWLGSLIELRSTFGAKTIAMFSAFIRVCATFSSRHTWASGPMQLHMTHMGGRTLHATCHMLHAAHCMPPWQRCTAQWDSCSLSLSLSRARALSFSLSSASRHGFCPSRADAARGEVGYVLKEGNQVPQRRCVHWRQRQQHLQKHQRQRCDRLRCMLQNRSATCDRSRNT